MYKFIRGKIYIKYDFKVNDFLKFNFIKDKFINLIFIFKCIYVVLIYNFIYCVYVWLFFIFNVKFM